MIAPQDLGPTSRHRVRRVPCGRCGRNEHVIEGDGVVICRVCLFAWGHFARALRAGEVIPEVGGIQLRHASHAMPLLGCPLCRADQVRSAASFDGWARGR